MNPNLYFYALILILINLISILAVPERGHAEGEGGGGRPGRGDQEAGDRGQQGGGGKEVSLWKKSRNFSSN